MWPWTLTPQPHSSKKSSGVSEWFCQSNRKDDLTTNAIAISATITGTNLHKWNVLWYKFVSICMQLTPITGGTLPLWPHQTLILWIWTRPKVALEFIRIRIHECVPRRDVISLGTADQEEPSSAGSDVDAKLWSGIIKPTLSVSSSEQRGRRLAEQKRGGKGGRVRWERR